DIGLTGGLLPGLSVRRRKLGVRYYRRFGQNRVEQPPYLLFVLTDNGGAKLINHFFDRFGRVRCDLSDKNFRMMCFYQMFTRYLQFLEKLFAVADTGENDVDVFVRCEPRKADHIFGKVEYPNRFAHIEDKYLAARTKRAGLQNKL